MIRALHRREAPRPQAVVNAGAYLLLLAGAVVMLVPIFWMVSTSLKTLASVFTLPVEWWPADPQWQNYVAAWNQYPFGRYFINSTLVASGTTLINVLFSAFAGYALAKFDFFGKQAIFLGILATLMLPIEVLMVPTFIVVRNLGWLDTYQAIIIPAAANAFGVFLMRQTMLHVPDQPCSTPPASTAQARCGSSFRSSCHSCGRPR